MSSTKPAKKENISSKPRPENLFWKDEEKPDCTPV
jgi:hypothetical protein